MLVLFDLVVTYSVFSNKMRIHNIHCSAEGCRGYRIKDARNCCSAMLRLVCGVRTGGLGAGVCPKSEETTRTEGLRQSLHHFVPIFPDMPVALFILR